MDDESRLTEVAFSEAPTADDFEGGPAPKRVSFRRVTQEQRIRERQYRLTHIVPVENLIKWGVPAPALALYGRWWQLERWIRDLVQLELQSCYRANWKSKVT